MQFADFIKRALEVRQQFAEYEQKKYGQEWTTAQLVQGFVVDVGDLVRLSMAKSGIRQVENLDEKLAHELADCLWSILVIAEKYDVDLETAFFANMDSLEAYLQNK